MQENIEYFKGKVCTVFTVPINRNFKEENSKEYPAQIYNYFLGVIVSFDEKGVVIQQAATGFRSYFLWDKIVGIAEEELITNKEELNKIEKKIEESKKEAKEIKEKYSKLSQGQYVDPDQLTALINQNNPPKVSS